MRYALKVKKGKKTDLVSADGREIGSGDVRQRVLHIVPKLFVSTEDTRWIDARRVEISKIEGCAGLDVYPALGVVVRQPYPNIRYFVGGSKERRMGWFVLLPNDIGNALELRITWDIHGNAVVVEHVLHINLRYGTGNVYSTDGDVWSAEGEQERKSLAAVLGRDDGCENILGTKNIIQYDTRYDRENQARICHLEEQVVIPGVPVDRLELLEEFEDEQLHELDQTTTFELHNEQHRKNGPIEFPPEIFVYAVQLAKSIPFCKDSDFARVTSGVRGGGESHPALKALCEWWGKSRPFKNNLKIGFVMPWVRVRDDGEYWCGYYEAPNVGLENFEYCRGSAARIGDVILLVFFASHEHFLVENDEVHLVLGDGTEFMTVVASAADINSGEHDETWYSLEALAGFPDRFPAAWAKVIDMAGRE